MCMAILPSGLGSSSLYIVSSPLLLAVHVPSDDLNHYIFHIFSRVIYMSGASTMSWQPISRCCAEGRLYRHCAGMHRLLGRCYNTDDGCGSLIQPSWQIELLS